MPPYTEADAFEAVPWRAVPDLDAEALHALLPFLRELNLARGAEFSPMDQRSPGLFFVAFGTVAVSGRMDSGYQEDGLLFGRGSVWGEDCVAGLATTAIQVRAVRDTIGYLLPAERVAEACAAVPALATAIERLAILRVAYVAFVDALRRDPRFATACIPALVGLVGDARIEQYPPGGIVCREGEPVAGLRLLVRGALSSRRTVNDRDTTEPIPAGSVFGGLLTTTSHEEPTTVTADEPSIVVNLPLPVLEERLATSRGLRRAALAIPALRDAMERAVEVVAVVTDKGWSERALVELLAQTLAELYGDRVAILRIVPPGGAGPAGPSDLVVRRDWRLPATGRLAGFRQQIAKLRPAEFVFVDASAVGHDVLVELEPAVARLACLGADTFGRPPVPYPQDKIRWAVDLTRAVVAGEPAYQPASVRLRLDRDAVARARTLADLSAADRERFARWARGLSERTVGIALGGGGAWGYAHVTLIQAIRQAGIPIDLVAGASFGSVAGAWYCSHVDEGFDGLFALAKEANFATRAAAISSYTIQRFVYDHITKANLEDLEIPLFPVATDVCCSAEAVTTVGPVAWGVRASSSFPGIFAPTTGQGFRFVDGGIIANVPTNPLVAQGADLVIASNIVPNPKAEVEQNPRFPGKIGRFLHNLDPIRRADDAFRSSLILMHTAGDAIAWTADVIYTSDPVRLSPANFKNGPQIAKEAEPSVARDLPAILARWRAVSAPGERGSTA